MTPTDYAVLEKRFSEACQQLGAALVEMRLLEKRVATMAASLRASRQQSQIPDRYGP